jgi:hypothetical protein
LNPDMLEKCMPRRWFNHWIHRMSLNCLDVKKKHSYAVAVFDVSY